MDLGLTRRRLATIVALLVVAVAVAVAVGALWTSRGGSSTLASRTDSIASQLRCPTCQELSVAQSDSQMALSMRAEIRSQLRHGRSSDEIRSWFVARYGKQVLLDPGTDGVALLLWVVPAAALVAGLTSIVLLHRRRARSDTGAAPPRPSPIPIPPRRLAIVATLLLAIGLGVTVASWQSASAGDTSTQSTRTTRMTASDWVVVAQSLERQSAYPAAARAYRKALGQQPDNAALRTRLAFVLVRTGKSANAASLVRPLIGHGSISQRAEALLVLGLSQWARQLPAAPDTLRRFLRLDPTNPAAGQIRQLLRSGE
jgi:cytochrome c-type biogenesis protein CcmH/NrfF